MDKTRVRIADVVPAQYAEFLKYCEERGKTYVADVTKVDLATYMALHKPAREEMSDVLSALNPEGARQVTGGVASAPAQPAKPAGAEATQVPRANDTDHGPAGAGPSEADRPLAQVFKVNPADFADATLSVLLLDDDAREPLERAGHSTAGDVMQMLAREVSQVPGMSHEATQQVVLKIANFVDLVNYLKATGMTLSAKDAFTKPLGELLKATDANNTHSGLHVVGLSEAAAEFLRKEAHRWSVGSLLDMSLSALLQVPDATWDMIQDIVYSTRKHLARENGEETASLVPPAGRAQQAMRLIMMGLNAAKRRERATAEAAQDASPEASASAGMRMAGTVAAEDADSISSASAAAPVSDDHVVAEAEATQGDLPAEETGTAREHEATETASKETVAAPEEPPAAEAESAEAAAGAEETPVGDASASQEIEACDTTATEGPETVESALGETEPDVETGPAEKTAASMDVVPVVGTGLAEAEGMPAVEASAFQETKEGGTAPVEEPEAMETGTVETNAMAEGKPAVEAPVGQQTGAGDTAATEGPEAVEPTPGETEVPVAGTGPAVKTVASVEEAPAMVTEPVATNAVAARTPVEAPASQEEEAGAAPVEEPEAVKTGPVEADAVAEETLAVEASVPQEIEAGDAAPIEEPEAVEPAFGEMVAGAEGVPTVEAGSDETDMVTGEAPVVDASAFQETMRVGVAPAQEAQAVAATPEQTVATTEEPLAIGTGPDVVDAAAEEAAVVEASASQEAKEVDAAPAEEPETVKTGSVETDAVAEEPLAVAEEVPIAVAGPDGTDAVAGEVPVVEAPFSQGAEAVASTEESSPVESEPAETDAGAEDAEATAAREPVAAGAMHEESGAPIEDPPRVESEPLETGVEAEGTPAAVEEEPAIETPVLQETEAVGATQDPEGVESGSQEIVAVGVEADTSEREPGEMAASAEQAPVSQGIEAPEAMQDPKTVEPMCEEEAAMEKAAASGNEPAGAAASAEGESAIDAPVAHEGRAVETAPVEGPEATESEPEEAAVVVAGESATETPTLQEDGAAEEPAVEEPQVVGLTSEQATVMDEKRLGELPDAESLPDEPEYQQAGAEGSKAGASQGPVALETEADREVRAMDSTVEPGESGALETDVTEERLQSAVDALGTLVGELDTVINRPEEIALAVDAGESNEQPPAAADSEEAAMGQMAYDAAESTDGSDAEPESPQISGNATGAVPPEAESAAGEELLEAVPVEAGAAETDVEMEPIVYLEPVVPPAAGERPGSRKNVSAEELVAEDTSGVDGTAAALPQTARDEGVPPEAVLSALLEENLPEESAPTPLETGNGEMDMAPADEVGSSDVAEDDAFASVEDDETLRRRLLAEADAYAEEGADSVSSIGDVIAQAYARAESGIADASSREEQMAEYMDEADEMDELFDEEQEDLDALGLAESAQTMPDLVRALLAGRNIPSPVPEDFEDEYEEEFDADAESRIEGPVEEWDVEASGAMDTESAVREEVEKEGDGRSQQSILVDEAARREFWNEPEETGLLDSDGPLPWERTGTSLPGDIPYEAEMDIGPQEVPSQEAPSDEASAEKDEADSAEGNVQDRGPDETMGTQMRGNFAGDSFSRPAFDASLGEDVVEGPASEDEASQAVLESGDDLAAQMRSALMGDGVSVMPEASISEEKPLIGPETQSEASEDLAAQMRSVLMSKDTSVPQAPPVEGGLERPAFGQMTPDTLEQPVWKAPEDTAPAESSCERTLEMVREEAPEAVVEEIAAEGDIEQVPEMGQANDVAQAPRSDDETVVEALEAVGDESPAETAAVEASGKHAGSMQEDRVPEAALDEQLLIANDRDALLLAIDSQMEEALSEGEVVKEVLEELVQDARAEADILDEAERELDIEEQEARAAADVVSDDAEYDMNELGIEAAMAVEEAEQLSAKVLEAIDKGEMLSDEDVARIHEADRHVREALAKEREDEREAEGALEDIVDAFSEEMLEGEGAPASGLESQPIREMDAQTESSLPPAEETGEWTHMLEDAMRAEEANMAARDEVVAGTEEALDITERTREDVEGVVAKEAPRAGNEAEDTFASVFGISPEEYDLVDLDALELAQNTEAELRIAGCGTVGAVLRHTAEDLMIDGQVSTRSLVELTSALERFVARPLSERAELGYSPAGEVDIEVMVTPMGIVVEEIEHPRQSGAELAAQNPDMPLRDLIGGPAGKFGRTGLSFLHLGIRPRTSLRQAGCATISDVLDLSWNELLTTRGMTRDAAREVADRIFERVSRPQVPAPAPAEAPAKPDRMALSMAQRLGVDATWFDWMDISMLRIPKRLREILEGERVLTIGDLMRGSGADLMATGQIDRSGVEDVYGQLRQMASIGAFVGERTAPRAPEEEDYLSMLAVLLDSDPDDYERTPVGKLRGLSSHTVQALEEDVRVDTVADLLYFSVLDLLETPELGTMAANQILRSLRKLMARSR